MKINKIEIGQLGLIQIDLKIIDIGTKGPRLTILAGLHGNESEGILVIQKILEEVKKVDNMRLKIIPCANPMGLVLSKRQEPIDCVDLNRSFPGVIDGNWGQRLTYNLFKLIEDSDMLIDLHSYRGEIPLTAIFMNNAKKKCRQKQMKMLSIIEPDLIWKLDVKSDNGFGGSLGPILAENGIANIGVEIARQGENRSKQINKVSKNIVKFIKNWPKESKNKKIIKIIKWHEQKSNWSGVFKSKVRLFQKVNKNDVIGEIFRLDNFKIENVKVLESGLIIMLNDNNINDR